MARTLAVRRDMDQRKTTPVIVPLVLHRVVKDTPKVFEDIDEKTFSAIVNLWFQVCGRMFHIQQDTVVNKFSSE